MIEEIVEIVEIVACFHWCMSSLMTLLVPPSALLNELQASYHKNGTGTSIKIWRRRPIVSLLVAIHRRKQSMKWVFYCIYLLCSVEMVVVD